MARELPRIWKHSCRRLRSSLVRRSVSGPRDSRFMIITVLWEDQRGVEVKRFGPHELLVACLTDELGYFPKRLVASHPKKGNGNVRLALSKDFARLAKSGPVLAVLDRDKIRDLWRAQRPSDCMTSISQTFRQDVPGNYDLVFLVSNVETLIEVACTALGERAPQTSRTRTRGTGCWQKQRR